MLALASSLIPGVALGQSPPQAVPAQQPPQAVYQPPSQLNGAQHPQFRYAPSDRLIQVRPDTQVQRGALIVPNTELERLVAESPDALRLARPADSQLRVGIALGASGIVSTLVGAILVPVGFALSTNPDGSPTPAAVATVATGVGLMLVGIGLVVIAGAVNDGAMKDWDEAVNTYNRQLLDGKLVDGTRNEFRSGTEVAANGAERVARHSKLGARCAPEPLKFDLIADADDHRMIIGDQDVLIGDHCESIGKHGVLIDSKGVITDERGVLSGDRLVVTGYPGVITDGQGELSGDKRVVTDY